MTVFKTFLKILNKNKFIVILYTVILLVFGGMNMSSQKGSLSFEVTKPSVLIVNNDEEAGITKDFIAYVKNNSDMPEIKDNEDARDDALFYEDVDLILYIPKNFSTDFLAGNNPEIEIKKRDDYTGAYAEMLITRYLNVADTYRKNINDEELLIKSINETLSKKAEANIITKLDTNALSRVTFYYNFASYSILACLIYIICLILSSFNETKVKKRTVISSTNYSKFTRKLLLSNCVYAVLVWALFAGASIFLAKDTMFSTHGALYLVNSFVFTICATTLAFLIGSIVLNKNAVTGIVNVVALGSSFLCGAFVPLSYLPDSVIKIAHILPTYYYIKTNEAITTMEKFDFETLKPLYINMGIILLFSLVFVTISVIVSKNKRKIG